MATAANQPPQVDKSAPALNGNVENLEDSQESSGVMSTLGVRVIQTIIFVYDFVTYPFYLAYQRPWNATNAASAIRAYPIEKTKDSITFQPIEKTCPEIEKFKAENIKTMVECFDFAVNQHSHKRMVGTRQVFSEEDEVQPNGKVFKKWVMGEYRWKTYLQVDEISTNFGRGLRELGLEPKSNVCIFADTKAEWLMCALGCFKQNFPLVTLYANLGEDAITFGVCQTEVTHVITTHELLPKFKNVLHKTPNVKYVIFLEDQVHQTDRTGYKQGVSIKSFNEVVALGSTSKAIAVKPTQDDPAIIMYTSGSTGVPKGVVLPHEALITTIKAFHFVVNPPKPDDIYLGYLPLAHILELLSEMTMIVQGIPVGYSSPNTMIDKSTKIKKGEKGDCSVLKPTLMCAVPLVIDRIYKGIKENVSKQGPFMEKLLSFCYKYKSYYRQKGYTTPIMDALIFRKMRSLVGGRIRLLLSGGAPLSPDTHDYVRCALSLPLVQGYGLTESCACCTIMDSDDNSTSRTGPPLQGVLVKLIDWDEGNYRITDNPPRGEVVIGGGNVATGYYKLAEKTKEEFSTDESGRRWFRTGDIGEMAPDGTLKIVDRKKDLVKLNHGEYVSLGKVESELKTCPLVENICVYGDPSQPFCIALVVPDRNKLTTLAEKFDLATSSFEELCTNKTVVDALLKELSQHGRKAGLEKFELPGAITLCTELWTPESGLVTAAFKLKRKPIQDYYQKDLKRMYGARRA